MSKQTLDCYILPSKPLPLILPVECIAEVVAKPQLEQLSEAPASWMKGHVNWQNQRLPVLSYGGLHDPDLDESGKRKPHLVVLNPIPNAARKAYSALMCYGDIKQVTVEPDMSFEEAPKSTDRRYIDAVIKIGKQKFIVPKLSSLGVAFTYF